jgi:RNA polymerase sigma factor (sigma-70 family)
MMPRLGLRTSNERTLESLYERHAADVYRYALMMLDSPSDAEDVTQTTFLNAYRALMRGERPRATGPWLRTIAHNLCLQHFRRAARRPREVELEEDAAELVSDDQGFVVEDLTRALKQIPVNQRAALLMRELEGRPIAEIAGILDLSTSAVETLLFRARRAVREQLEGGLTCAEAEHAISRQLDGNLKRSERGALRAHLRECEECAHLARSLRAQRGAFKALGAIPLPLALAWSKFGAGATAGGVASANAGAAASGGAWLAGSVAAKLAGATVLAALAAGASYEAAVNHPWSAGAPVAKVPIQARARGPAPRATAAAAAAAAAAALSGRTASAANPAATLGSPRAVAGRHAGGRNGAQAVHGRVTSTVTPSAAPSHANGARGRGRAQGQAPQPAGAVKTKRTARRSTKPKHSTRPTHPAKPTTAAKPTSKAKITATPGSGTPLKGHVQGVTTTASLSSTSP